MLVVLWGTVGAQAGEVAVVSRPVILERGEVEFGARDLSEREFIDLEADVALGLLDGLEFGARMGTEIEPEGLLLGDPGLWLAASLFRTEAASLALELGAPLPVQGLPGADLGVTLAFSMSEYAQLTFAPSLAAEIEGEMAFAVSLPTSLLLQPHERLFIETMLLPPVSSPLEALAAVGTTLGSNGPLCDIAIGGGGHVAEGHFHPEATVAMGVLLPHHHEEHIYIDTLSEAELAREGDAAAAAEEH